jgi:hypothetical protein
MSVALPHTTWRKAASILWFPVFFAIVLPIAFEVVYHQPEPHHIPIAVVANAKQVRLVTNALHRVDAGGFEVRRLPSTAAATKAVADRRDAAAYVGASAATLYLARAAAPLRASYLQGVFTTIASDSGRQPPRLVDLVPLRSGDGNLGIFFFLFPLMMTGVITAIVLLQLADWGVGRRATFVVAVGAIGALAAYLTVVDLHVLPGKPLLLVYAFVLTQVYGLLMVGAARVLKQFFLPVSLTIALILSVPSSGGTVAPDMMPALFRALSYVMPLAQGVTITRGIAYFHSTGIAQATLVLGLWAALAAVALAFAWRQQSHARPSEAPSVGNAEKATWLDRRVRHAS